MDSDMGEGIYRAMVEESGMAKLGASASALGIRIGRDIVPDQVGLVHRPAFNPHEPNGLSCVPTIQELPFFALPVEWGGTNMRTVVWKIETSDLGNDLVAQEDTAPGAPSRTMPYDDFVNAIQATRSKWHKVVKP